MDAIDYGEFKSANDDAIDSAMMLGVVTLVTLALSVGLALGVGLTLWLT